MPKVTTDFEHGEAQIFKNPFLESLTKTNPTSNIIFYGLSLIFFCYYAIKYVGVNIYGFLGLFAFVIFFWTFAEYMLHRYVFHWVNDSKFVQRFHFVMHGSHHQFPRVGRNGEKPFSINNFRFKNINL